MLLTDPRPRLRDDCPPRWVPQGPALSLPVPSERRETPFGDVLDRRVSIRTMNPIAFERVAELLWHAERTRGTGTGRFGLPWEHRAAASSGGIHAVHTVVVSGAEALAYDPVRHALVTLRRVPTVDRLREQVAEILPDARGTILVFAADHAALDRAYESAASLVLRDSGVLLATLHLCATWLELLFCPLGLLCDAFVQDVTEGALSGAGAAIVGEA